MDTTKTSGETLLIVLLVLTAAVLGVMVIGSLHSQEAYAAAASDRFGDYIMAVGARSTENDLLYVIDVPNKKLLVYFCDQPNNVFKIVDDRVNFENVFRSTRR